jgi:phosphoglycerate dehydrogenase-like enzyme
MHVALLESKLTCGAVVDSSVLGQPDVAEKLEQAQAVIALEFSADLLDDLSHGAASMALLQVPGAGTDRIDWDSLERYPQIAVCNAAGHEKAMAEYCMLAMLHHAHDFSEASSSFRAGDWRMSGRGGGPLHHELSAATVGILGLGAIGRATAERAAAFGMRVLACNRTTDLTVPGLAEDAAIYPLSDLKGMAAQCDYLVLTSALAPETEGILNETVIATMKPGAFLINVGRAGLADEQVRSCCFKPCSLCHGFFI